MILGIGTDIAHIDRIATVLDRHGQRFMQRCFAPEEQDYAARKTQDMAAVLARTWAAKEACAKALGSGIRDTITLKDIVVLRGSKGRPEIDLRGGARAYLQMLIPDGHNPHIHISISDEPPLACAFVVISAEAR